MDKITPLRPAQTDMRKSGWDRLGDAVAMMIGVALALATVLVLVGALRRLAHWAL